MSNFTKKTENTLITFHIGRGGRFHNAGHKQYVDQDKEISTYTDDLFIRFENIYEVNEKIKNNSILSRNSDEIQDLIADAENGMEKAFEQLAIFGITRQELGELYYFTCGGSNTGLPVNNDGTGMIDIDRDYDTTIVTRLADLSEDEARMVLSSGNWVSADVREYLLDAHELRSEFEHEEEEEAENEY